MIQRLLKALNLFKPRQPRGKVQNYLAHQTSVNSSVVLVTDILSENQINRALIYYRKHKDPIDNMVKLTKNSYEPSQIEDKNDPMIWKAEYWKWFLTLER
jgi:hypothetical protein